ncbi:hypothetical protein ABPG72_015923 [Tetrahymena utriculariae]
MSPKKQSFLDQKQFMQHSKTLISQEGFQDTILALTPTIQNRSLKINSQKLPFQKQIIKNIDSFQVLKRRRCSNCINNQEIKFTNQINNQIQQNNERSQSQIINQTSKEEIQNYYKKNKSLLRLKSDPEHKKPNIQQKVKIQIIYFNLKKKKNKHQKPGEKKEQNQEQIFKKYLIICSIFKLFFNIRINCMIQTLIL